MPQELRVVRCFQCLKYQVDIVKKANKWVCKLCGVKQSLAREFFRGSGKDCRSMVQQLSIRNLEIDQQEAEVTKLVLENKIQIPEPPVETASVSTITETNRASHGPSKWETFLTKESNDDLSDAVCSSESFESVSSTTFDRERINNPATGARDCNNRRMNREDLWDYEEQRFPNVNNEPLSRSNSATGQKKPAFNPVRSASKVTHNTFFQNANAEKRAYSAGNDTMGLSSFHRKENLSSRTFQKPTKNISQANIPQKPSTSEVASSSKSYKPPEMPCKRKFADVFATPMMNFGKRTVVERGLPPAASAESLGSANDTEPQSKAKPASVSSKWVKYLPEDDVTNENTDNNFIIF
uniref:MRN complex-interacting protein N-terminal domain-containing protein n=1 Tax=Anopheles minimus TaxID=112268 RepID=A0A182WNH4_9DIPT